MYKDKIPQRVRVLVLGGGIHGVGLLHDLASRGWQDVHLLEKATIGAGTSSKSTKLIHGGLRYLKNIADYGLVAESLKERRLLIDLAGDIVKPLELYFPILESGGERSWMVKAGLILYEKLAGSRNLGRHHTVTRQELEQNAAILRTDQFRKIYSFWDAQTDDLALVNRVAASAHMLGAGISEGVYIRSIAPSSEGWDLELINDRNQVQKISALYVLNCLGPWANEFLSNNNIKPKYEAINNKGVHLILPDLGLKVGIFMQSPSDNRISFLLPWQGKSLLGTTEEVFSGNPDQLSVRDDEVRYLLEQCNRYLKREVQESEVIMSFAGLRWLAVDSRKDISATSRECVVGTHSLERGEMHTIYGGKLTSYRSLSKKIGDKITRHFGDFRPSCTHEKNYWVSAQEEASRIIPSLESRFGDSLRSS